ncbi:MAG: FxsA family protein [Campylobacterota bacterium]|nr:FxsA family protein [Campylobacterota bacterium]
MIYFLIYLFTEVMISSSIASQIGGLNTFFEIIVSAIVGIFLLQNFKFSLQESIKKAQTGQITQEEFIKTNVGRAIGALLLIIPGFFTDIIGVALQFGFLTILFSKIFKFKKNNTNNEHTQYGSFQYTSSSFNNATYKKKEKNNDEIIDVEIVDDNKSIKH